MKSQKKIDSTKFDDAVIDVIVEWDSVFPDEPYFNKLHFVMCHLPEFVRRYHICGRASAESHESVHATMQRMKNSIKRMSSTRKMYQTLFARTTASLKAGMAEREKKINDKQSGIKRGVGTYNTNCSTKRQDDVHSFTNKIW